MEIDREKIKSVAQKYDLEFVVLFGSQATGQTHSKSDIDDYETELRSKLLK